MSYTVVNGNIFTSECQTIVNTVNCVGVMGAGLALECRLRYPKLYAKYQEHCKRNLIRPGKLSLYKTTDRWVLNFPTKLDWRAPSDTKFLHAGLEKFCSVYEQLGIESVAFPLLGASLGGIATETSEAILRSYLAQLPLQIEIYDHDPDATDDLAAAFQHWFCSGGHNILRNEFKIRRPVLDRISAAINNNKLQQLSYLSEIDGLGIKSLESIFGLATSGAFQSPQQGLLAL